MRCPWCGASPVTIRGNTWECGFCGDTGILRADQLPQVTVTLTVNQEEANSQAEERCAAPSPQKAQAPKARRRGKGWLVAILLVLLAIGAACFYLLVRYDAARTNLMAGEFSAAEAKLEGIPSFFRDREALSGYAHSCVLAERDTVEDLTLAKAILQGLSHSYDGEFAASISARLAAVTARLDALRSQQAAP